METPIYAYHVHYVHSVLLFHERCHTDISSCFQLSRTSCRLWMPLIAWLDPLPASAASQSSCRAVTANVFRKKLTLELWKSIKHPKSVRKPGNQFLRFWKAKNVVQPCICITDVDIHPSSQHEHRHQCQHSGKWCQVADHDATSPPAI